MARIALDIDSTLHHYWDLLQRIARERYGVELPYEEQRDWGITVLERDAIVHCVEESHSDENIAAGVPYPDAVETVREWHEAGHWIHVTSHRRRSTHEATAAWLDRIGMPCDDLHCSFDKVPRCVELGIDVLVDDSPVNIAKARAEGSWRRRSIHPWNEEIVETDGVIGAPDWSGSRPRSTRCWNASTGRLLESARACRSRGAQPCRSASARRPPTALVPAEELKKHLPGRRARAPAERLGPLGAHRGHLRPTLVDFFYRYWFRAEVEGIENVPATRRRAARLQPRAARCRRTRR